MEKKVKMGMGALWIVGFTFGLIGLSFLVVGAGLYFVPADADARIVALVFLPMGAAFLLGGGVALLVQRAKKKRAQRMVDAGRYLWAEIVEFRPNYNVCFNGRNPYIVVVRHTDTQGRHHLFKSESMMKLCPDPALYGKRVKVYYEDTSFRHYYVDVSELSENVIEH